MAPTPSPTTHQARYTSPIPQDDQYSLLVIVDHIRDLLYQYPDKPQQQQIITVLEETCRCARTTFELPSDVNHPTPATTPPDSSPEPEDPPIRSGSPPASTPEATNTNPDPDPAPAPGKKRPAPKSVDAPRKRPERFLLEPLELALNPDVQVPLLIQRRDTFCARLQELSFTIQQDFKTVPSSFYEQLAADVTNFFFHEVMGPRGRDRVIETITCYTARTSNAGSAIKAAKLVADPDTPAAVRNLCLAYKGAYLPSNKGSESFSALLRNIDLLDLFHHWNTLNDLASAKDPELVEFLRSQGFPTSRGRDWRTPLKRFLMHQLQIPSKNKFNNDMQLGSNLEGLVQAFGPAILILVPPSTSNTLKTWGAQRMVHAYELFKEIVPEFEGVCRSAEPVFYTPFLTGEPLTLQLLPDPTSLAQVFHNESVQIGTVAGEVSQTQAASISGSSQASLPSQGTASSGVIEEIGSESPRGPVSSLYL